MSDSDKKDLRRQKQILNRTKSKDQVSEEQKHLSRSKKQLKIKIKEIQADEIWEDWENENY